MGRYRASIEALWTLDEAFAYLSDFSTSAEWVPGVVEAERVGTSPVGADAEFRPGAGLRAALDRPAPGAVGGAA